MILFLSLISLLNFLSMSFACSSNSDCPHLNICSGDDCIHKSLYPPAAEEIIGTILIIILGALANAGGLGGGIFMIPLLILLFFFTTHEAVPLSSIFVFGGSLIAFGLRFKQKHPTRYRPVIMYEMIMVLISPLLVGTTVGVLVNQMFSEWLIQAILTIVLGYTGITIANKGIRLYKEESRAKKLKIYNKIPTDSNSHQAPQARNEASNLSQSIEPNIMEQESLPRPSSSLSNKKLESIYARESSLIPLREFSIFIISYSIVILYTFLNGGRGLNSPIGIQRCSPGFIGLILSIIICLAIVTFFIGKYVIKQTEIKNELRYNWDEFDLKWTRSKVVTITLVSFTAGIAAGLLGIGGGLVVGPLMLAYGIRPQVLAATSSFMILFTSSLAVVQYGVAGMLNLEYAIYFLLVSFIGSAAGVLIVKKLVDKYERASFIVLSLALVILLSAVILPIYLVIRIVELEEEGKAEYGFKSMC